MRLETNHCYLISFSQATKSWFSNKLFHSFGFIFDHQSSFDFRLISSLIHLFYQIGHVINQQELKHSKLTHPNLDILYLTEVILDSLKSFLLRTITLVF